ncbi:hypothetical protein SARC_18319, partial [Sphaeroforma arctica JP610]
MADVAAHRQKLQDEEESHKRKQQASASIDIFKHTAQTYAADGVRGEAEKRAFDMERKRQRANDIYDAVKGEQLVTDEDLGSIGMEGRVPHGQTLDSMVQAKRKNDLLNDDYYNGLKQSYDAADRLRQTAHDIENLKEMDAYKNQAALD